MAPDGDLELVGVPVVAGGDEAGGPSPATAADAIGSPSRGSDSDPPAAAPQLPGGPERHPVPEGIRDADPVDLAPALEAICLALNRAISISEAAAILGRSTSAVTAAADVLAAELRRGGLMLQRHHDELQLVTRPEVAWAVTRALNPERPGRLSRAALETLAIVAYRQPVTRGAVEAIRGVGSESVLDSLERRELIADVGRQDSPGHPRLYGTTLRFLQVVGLERIEDLPRLGPDAVPRLDAEALGIVDTPVDGDEPVR